MQKWTDAGWNDDDWEDSDKLEKAEKVLLEAIAFVSGFKLSDGTTLENSIGGLEDELSDVRSRISNFHEIVAQRIRDRRDNAGFDEADHRRDQRLECAA